MKRRKIRKTYGLALCGLIVIGANSGVLQAQEDPLPEEAERLWGDQDDWPMLSPGDLDIDPSRVVGTRAVYRFESRLHKEDPRSEVRVWQIENGTQFGEPILILNQDDAGSSNSEQMFSRHTTWYVDPDTFSLKFILGADPLSSTQRVVHFLPEQIVNTGIEKDGITSTLTMTSEQGLFTYRTYPPLLAAMNLEEGMKFRLLDYEFWESSTQEQGVRVDGTREIKDTTGKSHEVRVVSWNAGGGWVTEYYIGDEWPYYFGQEVRNYGVNEGRTPIYRATFVEAQRLN